MSKITTFVAVIGLLASVSIAQAGGKNEPIIEADPQPEIVAAAPSSEGGMALPILLGLLVLGAVAGGSSSSSGTTN